ncbi:hypothetical protein GCM10009741_39540 [Kribbella lupini]|uniref:Pentapeptide repeat protein n=2 Tax=Kribbella lupini TaxID=291602 RepID=A0ABP4LX31_9ACTN
MVGDPNLVESDVELLELQAFDKTQAKQFIKKKLDRVGDRSQRVERAQKLIERDAGGFGIYGSPFFLSEFVELIRGDKFSIAKLGAREFVDFLVQVAYKRERERQGHGFSDDEQQRFLEAIALDMLQSGAAYYALEDLEVFALEAIASSQETINVPDPEGRRRVSKLFSHHFLSAEEGQVGSSQAATIRHQVWRDYYQGTSLARALVPALPEALLVLNRRDLSDGVARSVVAAIGAELTVPQQFVVKFNDVGLRNVLRLLSAAVPVGDDGQLNAVPSDLSERLSGRDFRDVTISGLDLRGKDLRHTNLSGALFSNCDLRDVAWDGALLSGTAFVGCSVDSRLSTATNASSTIDDIEYFGPQLSDRWAEPILTDITNPAEMRESQEDYVLRIIAGRLAKFYRGGRLDSAISWPAFMGGLPPIDRDFVIRRVVRALKTEGFVAEDRGAHGSRPPFILTGDVGRRQDVLLLIHDGVAGETIQAVCDRLVRKA